MAEQEVRVRGGTVTFGFLGIAARRLYRVDHGNFRLEEIESIKYWGLSI
jgi:hypothetical protein